MTVSDEYTPEQIRAFALEAARAANPDAKQEDLEANLPAI